MSKMKIFLRVLLIFSLLSLTLPLVSSTPRTVRANILEFGYTLDDSVPYQWMDATPGLDAGFNEMIAEQWVGTDDGFSGALDLGFDFPFFDYAYPQVFISTNGLLTFGEGTLLYDNTAIPRTSPPDNYIAPFWDDLAIGDTGNPGQGEVYYLAGETDGQRFFVVEWHEVTRKGNQTDLLTFEAILYESGKICFQYASLQGELDSATIGIEDGDGVDGLAYLYNQPGLEDLEANRAVCFNHPGQTVRVKTLPIYQSDFIQQTAKEFSVVVRNIGELGSDTYDIALGGLSADWEVSLLRSAAGDFLPDTDGDSLPDTGPLAPGEENTILVRVEPRASLSIGASIQITLTATSSLDPAVSEEAIIHAAVPAPFVQIYSDSQEGMFIDIIGETGRSIYPVKSDFTGSTITIAGSNEGHYIYAWERNGYSSIYYSDIEYVMLNQFGQVIHPLAKLTSNATATLSTRDHFPSIAFLPDGRMGVLWVRKILNSAWETNSNVYFAVLDQDGQLSYGPFNVTNNDGWRGASSLDVPVFVHPRLAAADDGHFILTWLLDRLLPEGEISDIYLAVFNAAGEQVLAPVTLAASSVGETQYQAPAPIEQAGGKILVTYARSELSSGSSRLYFQVFNSSGAVVLPETALLVGEGEAADGIQLASGEIILAWIDPSDDRLAYAVLDPSSYQLLSGPHRLASPYERQAAHISVTTDPEGHAILTWMDGEENDYLYYALVDYAGNLLTAPLIFANGAAGDPQILTSTAAEGNAPYQPGRVFLPLVDQGSYQVGR